MPVVTFKPPTLLCALQVLKPESPTRWSEKFGPAPQHTGVPSSDLCGSSGSLSRGSWVLWVLSYLLLGSMLREG